MVEVTECKYERQVWVKTRRALISSEMNLDPSCRQPVCPHGEGQPETVRCFRRWSQWSRGAALKTGTQQVSRVGEKGGVRSWRDFQERLYVFCSNAQKPSTAQAHTHSHKLNTLSQEIRQLTGAESGGEPCVRHRRVVSRDGGRSPGWYRHPLPHGCFLSQPAAHGATTPVFLTVA